MERSIIVNPARRGVGPELVRFNELRPEHVNRDLQVHTVATDGEGTIDQLIARARELGLQELGFTEHVRQTSAYYSGFVDEVVAKRRDAGLRIYVGMETKVIDEQGTLDASPEALAKAELVLGSVHRFPVADDQFIDAKTFTYAEAAKRELALALGLLRQAPIHVLAHPGGMCQRAFSRFPEDGFIALMEAANERGVAIEINTSYTRDLDGFLDLCRRINPIVSIGSDVHRINELGTCRDALRARGIGRAV